MATAQLTQAEIDAARAEMAKLFDRFKNDDTPTEERLQIIAAAAALPQQVIDEQHPLFRMIVAQHDVPAPKFTAVITMTRPDGSVVEPDAAQ